MQPLKLVIPGEFWDSQVYMGRLFLFQVDGSLRVLDWDRLIEQWQVPPSTKLAMECAFSRSDYLYGDQWTRLFKDEEIREVLQNKFQRLASRRLILENPAFDRSLLVAADSPFPFPHADTTMYMGTMYAASRSGIFMQGSDQISQSSSNRMSAERMWDGPAVAIDASLRTLAVAAGEAGLFEISLEESSAPSPPIQQVSDRHCSECNWMYSSIFASSHTDGGSLADYSEAKQNSEEPESRPVRKLERVVPAAEIFNRRSYAWGSKDKLCSSVDGWLKVANYKPWRKVKPRLDLFEQEIKFSEWKGDVVSGAVAGFGTVIELDHALVVAASDGLNHTFPGEPVSWRVFNRSKHYENQLHVVYEDRLEILSFNHDYFVDQGSKISGLKHSGGFQRRSSNERK